MLRFGTNSCVCACVCSCVCCSAHGSGPWSMAAALRQLLEYYKHYAVGAYMYIAKYIQYMHDWVHTA